MARVVKLDERRRKKIRRRRWLKEIDSRLKRLESSVTVLNAEQVAAELVTVGRSLVRVLREFDEAWPTEGAQGQVGEERSPPYGLQGEQAPPPASATGQPDGKPREMTYPEYWQMIATALDELAGQLEQLSVEAVQRALAWHQSQRSLAPYRATPAHGRPQADPGEDAHGPHGGAT